MTLATVRGSLTVLELDPPHSVEPAIARRRGVGGEPGLAGSTGARDRDESLTAQQLVDGGQFGLTTDERRQLDGQVVGDAVERTQRR